MRTWKGQAHVIEHSCGSFLLRQEKPGPLMGLLSTRVTWGESGVAGIQERCGDVTVEISVPGHTWILQQPPFLKRANLSQGKAINPPCGFPTCSIHWIPAHPILHLFVLFCCFDFPFLLSSLSSWILTPAEETTTYTDSGGVKDWL